MMHPHSTVAPRAQILRFLRNFLKDLKCGELKYGRNVYDDQEGTLIFISLGQVAGNDDNGETFRLQGYALLFHPDLFKGTSMVRHMKDDSFFPTTPANPFTCRTGNDACF